MYDYAMVGLRWRSPFLLFFPLPHLQQSVHFDARIVTINQYSKAMHRIYVFYRKIYKTSNLHTISNSLKTENFSQNRGTTWRNSDYYKDKHPKIQTKIWKTSTSVKSLFPQISNLIIKTNMNSTSLVDTRHKIAQCIFRRIDAMADVRRWRNEEIS